MSFDLSEEQKALDQSLRRVLGRHLQGGELVRRFDQAALDEPIWADLNGMGLGGILVPQEEGGLELDLVTLSVVAEALGHFAAPVPMIANALAAWAVARAGTTAQKQRWLGGLLDGTIRAAFALTEKDGWRPDGWAMEGPTLAGEKIFVEAAAWADLFLVGTKGGLLHLVPAGAGVTVTPLDTLDRMRPLATVAFDAAPADPLAADPEIADRLVDAMAILLAADARGAGAAALEMATAYAKTRNQFGRVIGSFQALKHQLADMAVELEPARALVWYAAHAWDALPAESPRAAAIAKSHVTDVAVAVGRAAVEAHGGIGYTWEYPVHIFLKRAMFDRALLGSPREHRARMADLAGW
jgi:alkylation response protein AidB-like acyl-CoA dehydrogenase